MSLRNEKAARDLEGIARTLRAADRRVDNIAPLGPSIGALLSRSVRRQFATKGVYMGTPWKPLAASTIADKIRKGFPAPAPLIRTRELWLSFVGRPMGIEKYTAKTLEYGSPLRKAMWQQKGTRRNGRRHIPPRKMLVITRQIRSEVNEKIADWVLRGKVS